MLKKNEIVLLDTGLPEYFLTASVIAKTVNTILKRTIFEL